MLCFPARTGLSAIAAGRHKLLSEKDYWQRTMNVACTAKPSIGPAIGLYLATESGDFA
jgi:hypothetical protein